MNITNDQYIALSKLVSWYEKYNHQVIEISGVMGTGVEEVINLFIQQIDFDPREIMYLSFDQKQVLEMAAKRFHAYYINRIIYNYIRIVDFDSLPVINNDSNEVKYKWVKKVRKKIDPKYKLIVVFDSTLLNHQTLYDLTSFGLPIILVRDPELIPAPDSFTFLRDANINLRELNTDLLKQPINYFANKILHGSPIKLGNYDNVSVIPKKQLNSYTLKSSEMIITLADDVCDYFNKYYREKILKFPGPINHLGERIVIMSDMYAHKIVNPDEKNIKLYLTKGSIGYISKCNKHALGTKYIPISFKPDFYHESFEDIYIDRNYLNGIEIPSRQQIPDEVMLCKYAYALTPQLARLSHWDKVTIISDYNEDPELKRKLLYNAISRAKQSFTLVC